MNRYVLKINDSTYISNIHWIAFEIPEIRTNNFENAMIVTDEYLNEVLTKTSFGTSVTKIELIQKRQPQTKVVKIKIVEVADNENVSKNN